ncbi:hypothetical protein DWW92_08725 [Escherichia coli]|nr:hypothetical protein [Escherichia coli]EEW8390441.1 hypothetical protein [Escherichia coli]EEW9198236.1 hypothetical protein [Escherichia coli]EGD5034160.1 hypothetical protein [Escherichia coli]EGD5975303.1 hypothetical protein [Escherichia coli]
MPAILFINRLTDASILVSGSDDAMHKNLEACAWRGQVGVAMATSLKALPDRDKTKNPRLVNHI